MSAVTNPLPPGSSHMTSTTPFPSTVSIVSAPVYPKAHIHLISNCVFPGISLPHKSVTVNCTSVFSSIFNSLTEVFACTNLGLPASIVIGNTKGSIHGIVIISSSSHDFICGKITTDAFPSMIEIVLSCLNILCLIVVFSHATSTSAN